MLDIRLLRENPELVRERLQRREASLGAQVDAILECDTMRRRLETETQNLQAERKRLSKEIGMLRAKGENSQSIEDRAREIGETIGRLGNEAAEWEEKQRQLLLTTPNLPQETVPVGQTAADNPVLRVWGEKPRLERVEDHVAIATRLGLLEIERAAKISGSGFVCYTGAGARLERALLNFLLNLHTDHHGYREISPPFLIRQDCMVGTSQLPKFAEDMYAVADSDLYLAPTAEVPVTNLHREEILRPEELPIRYAAYTPCFRREAGSAGRDTRGLIRMHQFDKVELVKICHPDESDRELEALTADAEKVLQLLGLHYRVIDLCTGDLGFGSARTYDIEVWSPGQDTYLEVSSCSNFEDYQARRMQLRFKGEDGKNRFCHTLNGSGTALARLFVALLENGLQPDGTVRLPEPLHAYFGADRIG